MSRWQRNGYPRRWQRDHIRRAVYAGRRTAIHRIHRPKVERDAQRWRSQSRRGRVISRSEYYRRIVRIRADLAIRTAVGSGAVDVPRPLKGDSQGKNTGLVEVGGQIHLLVLCPGRQRGE